MVVEHGKIIKCTDQELYEYWLKMWADFYDYEDYKRRVINEGTVITD